MNISQILYCDSGHDNRYIVFMYLVSSLASDKLVKSADFLKVVCHLCLEPFGKKRAQLSTFLYSNVSLWMCLEDLSISSLKCGLCCASWTLMADYVNSCTRRIHKDLCQFGCMI